MVVFQLLLSLFFFFAVVSQWFKVFVGDGFAADFCARELLSHGFWDWFWVEILLVKGAAFLLLFWHPFG